MKFLETSFSDYIEKTKKYDLHKSITYIKDISNINDLQNIIIHGPDGIGKYNQALNIIHHFSPTSLKYDKKFNIVFQNKHNYNFKMSDIHFEVDMELLGCNARALWHEIYSQI